jgi:hypothetical protein
MLLKGWIGNERDLMIQITEIGKAITGTLLTAEKLSFHSSTHTWLLLDQSSRTQRKPLRSMR